MPSFQYQSLSADGQVRTGVLAATDRAEVVRRLLDQGETATRIDAMEESRSAAKSSNAPSASSFSFSRGTSKASLNRSEMATLMRELATALEAGLPLMSALTTMRRQASKKAAPILDHLITRVEAGDTLYSAAADYGGPFDDMVIGMLRAADASGDMSVVMHQLADLLERSVELRREVTGATFYPLIVFSLLIVSVILLVTVLVPRLIEPMVSEQGFNVPLPTQILMNIADFFQSAWYILLITIAGITIGWRVWISAPANRLIFHRFLLKVPALGRLLRDVAVARFTRTLGTLTASGLPLLDALRITKGTLGNAALTDAITSVEDQVTGGKALADPLERTGLFPPMLIQVINLGERSGRLDQMLMHASDAFDRQVRQSIKLFTKALPPFLMIFMALLGGFVLLAILLPLLEMQSLVGA